MDPLTINNTSPDIMQYGIKKLFYDNTFCQSSKLWQKVYRSLQVQIFLRQQKLYVLNPSILVEHP